METQTGVSRKCCVANCANRSSKVHRFPKNEPEIFKAWVQRIRPPNFQNLTEIQIYNKYYVCDEHFSRDCVVPGTKRGLQRNAIPSLNIPDIQSISEEISVETVGSSAIPKVQMCVIATEEVATPSTSNVETDRSIQIQPSVDRGIETRDRGTKKRRLFLHEVNVSRAIDLTPKAKKLYHTLSSWSTRMSQMKRRITSYRVRLANSEKFINSPQFGDLLKYVNLPTYNFFVSQLKNQLLQPHARRYSLDEKILALSIAKASGKAYRLISKIFVLPSIRTLRNLMRKIPLQPGINEHVFHSLGNSVQKMKSSQEKVCILIFDEMAIDSGVFYQQGEDNIVGFEDDGLDRKPVLANHVNVFMLKGIYKQWKQPVVFTFHNGPIKAVTLKMMIKNIILRCQKIGLEVIATVCDQGSTNQSAIKALIEETRQDCTRRGLEHANFGFVVGCSETVPLFDVPHLMKGIRNNLLQKNLHFILNGEEKIAKWSHIEQFYKLDSLEPNLRLCNKLTDAHVIKDKINKMKVKNCTQVFSHTVGALMKRISQWDTGDDYNLTVAAGDTAELVLFLDNLFDSLNVSSKFENALKPLKGQITEKSRHGEFWKNALDIIKSMKFYCLEKKSFVNTPSLKNLIFTIQGFIYLKEILLVKMKFNYILTRGFNQDPLENFFGYIRSHGYRNIHPDVPHFTNSFKTLVINNFMSYHSPGSNCEEDIATEGLDNLRSFLTGELVAGVQPLESTSPPPDDSPIQGRTKVGRCTLAYIGGYINKLLKKNIKDCQNCQNNVSFRDRTEEDDDFIEARQYSTGNLIRPGTYVYYLIRHSLNYLFYLIPRLAIRKSLSKLLAALLKKKLSFIPINCAEHKLGDKLCEITIKCALFWWCKSINKIVKGKDTKFFTFVMKNQKAPNIDPIKLHAHKLYKSKCKYSRKKK